VELEKWSAPLVQGGDYQEKEPEIRRDDDVDDDNHHCDYHDDGDEVDISHNDTMITIKVMMMMMIIRNKSV
jgi:hypothetical protein